MIEIYRGSNYIHVEFDEQTFYLEDPAADFFLSQIETGASQSMTGPRERFQWLPCRKSDDGIPGWKRSEYIEFCVEWERKKAEEKLAQSLEKIRSYMRLAGLWRVRCGDILQTLGSISGEQFVGFDESKKLMIYLSAYKTEWSYSLGWALGLPEFGEPLPSFDRSLPLSTEYARFTRSDQGRKAS